jgi:site-specific DNA-cytosine methylase
MTFRLLDLFCGLGGWTDGFLAEGFEADGIDSARIVAPHYRGNLILQDILTVDGRMLRGKYDVIVGSPPCRDFSKSTWLGKVTWKRPPDPESSLSLVHKFIEIVGDARPEIWLMENVPQLQNYLDLKPEVVARLTPTMVRAFWGSFPPFLIPVTGRVQLERIGGGRLRSWNRARIPLPVARAFARACRERLEGG